MIRKTRSSACDCSIGAGWTEVSSNSNGTSGGPNTCDAVLGYALSTTEPTSAVVVLTARERAASFSRTMRRWRLMTQIGAGMRSTRRSSWSSRATPRRVGSDESGVSRAAIPICRRPLTLNGNLSTRRRVVSGNGRMTSTKA